MTEPLYTRELLRLATQIPNLGKLEKPGGSAEKRAKTCGSKVTADVVLDSNGAIAKYAWEIHACAFGQASAAILGPNLIGMTHKNIAEATGRMKTILAGGEKRDSDCTAIEHLMAASDYPARHPAILLPYQAILSAIESAHSSVPAA